MVPEARRRGENHVARVVSCLIRWQLPCCRYCADGLAVLRSARSLRQVELGLPTVPALDTLGDKTCQRVT